MPEDIPEPPAVLTEEEVGMRASDWADFRRDYGSADDAVRKREYAAFCAGWDARHTSRYLTPAQQDAIDRVKHMIEANSHVTASITEALYTDAADRAEAATIAAGTQTERDALEAVREQMAEPTEPEHPIHPDAAARIIERFEKAGADWEGVRPTLAGIAEWYEEHCRMNRHLPIQHRDARPPWCRECGLTAYGTVPLGPLDRPRTRREARATRVRSGVPITPEMLEQFRGEVAPRTPAFCEASREIDGRACILMPEHGGDHDYSRVPKRPIRDEPQA
ncbi:hypothetical protein QDA03_gp16 [Microbacterium phage Terij]|uniref:Uncharacterized protein n=1 Tax=Microbacterium phage Terij TaxID=2686229 RepID=A0A6B9LEW4_9CAUD|nr:hypothetical protein QDA03_gp16 [Microbacterium phage Terij]QHB37225.1 hypothetical protein SEA_TERIJ_91 [Microbacterium phage Terij]